MSVAFPEPDPDRTDVGEWFCCFLDFYRATAVGKVRGLGVEDLRTAHVPSGWTPLGLLNHLVHMERRWFQWGFAAEATRDPWGDAADGGGWRIPDGATVDGLARQLGDVGRRTTTIVRAHRPDEPAALGGRFQERAEAPTLGWICAHVLQEYARHTGHLDLVRELVDGSVGE